MKIALQTISLLLLALANRGLSQSTPPTQDVTPIAASPKGKSLLPLSPVRAALGTDVSAQLDRYLAYEFAPHTKLRQKAAPALPPAQ